MPHTFDKEGVEPLAKQRPGLLSAFVRIITEANIADVAAQGREFNWNRPDCPTGCLKVWGHGFVSRAIEGFAGLLYLKRWRCPTCHTVFIMVPADLWANFRSEASTIFETLVTRFLTRQWPANMPRQRAGHWMRRLIAKCRMDFTQDDPLICLRQLHEAGIRFLV